MIQSMLHHLTQTYGAVAGLPLDKCKFHCLTYAIATYVLDAHRGLACVKDGLGHVNIQNTTMYARRTTATLDAQAQTIFVRHEVV
jgi:hypothetical protein